MVLAPVVTTVLVLVCEPESLTPDPCELEMLPLSTKVPAAILRLLSPATSIPVPLMEFPLIDK